MRMMKLCPNLKRVSKKHSKLNIKPIKEIRKRYKLLNPRRKIKISQILMIKDSKIQILLMEMTKNKTLMLSF